MSAELILGLVLFLATLVVAACGSYIPELFLAVFCRRRFVPGGSDKVEIVTGTLWVICLALPGAGFLWLANFVAHAYFAGGGNVVRVAIATFEIFLVWRWLVATGLLVRMIPRLARALGKLLHKVADGLLSLAESW